jgi:hypothetical protein
MTSIGVTFLIDNVCKVRQIRLNIYFIFETYFLLGKNKFGLVFNFKKVVKILRVGLENIFRM